MYKKPEDIKATKPDYYKSEGGWDVIDICQRFQLPFDLGNVLKYIVRAGFKDPDKHIEDLEKAKEYLERRIKFLRQNE